MTPLLAIRTKRSLTGREVAIANGIDPGQYSRMERGLQPVTTGHAEKLARYFGHQITELQLLYPERYPQAAEVA